MDRLKLIEAKFGDKYKIFVKQCKRLDINILQDGELVVKGDGETYVFILKPKDLIT